VLAVRPDATLYADVPYALHPGTCGFELPGDVDRTGRRRREVRLDPETAARKVVAARCYESQLPRLEQDHGPFVNSVDLAREVFWERTPAGGGLVR
jgi:hypothetical protein